MVFFYYYCFGFYRSENQQRLRLVASTEAPLSTQRCHFLEWTRVMYSSRLATIPLAQVVFPVHASSGERSGRCMRDLFLAVFAQCTTYDSAYFLVN